jgi:ketosteroid isomerase-like protein
MSDEGSGDAAQANRELIERLYAALNRHDGEGMAACYSADAAFSDPVFTALGPGEVRDMWRMLCSRTEDLKVDASDIEATETEGSAHWVATYTFSTGRFVRNDIRARFRFENGLIVEHEDTFSLSKWAGQALGPAGKLFGWSPPIQGAIRRQAASGLRDYQEGPTESS